MENWDELWEKEIENLSDPELLAKFGHLGYMKRSRSFDQGEKDAYSLQFELAAKELLKRLANKRGLKVLGPEFTRFLLPQD